MFCTISTEREGWEGKRERERGRERERERERERREEGRGREGGREIYFTLPVISNQDFPINCCDTDDMFKAS